MTGFAPPLPIDAVLEELTAHLAARGDAVLVAPPGAGKTTRVPLILLGEPWAAEGRILLLEPRRLAARAAAERMSATLGEALGGTIGLRMRLETRVSARTRIEVITEGVFARMILDDPSLEGVAAVLFDEFHERSLDADLGLALALDVRAGLRSDLRLVVMSATLDGGRVAQLLGDAPVVTSEGRAFSVATVYLGRDPRERIDDAVVRAVMRGLAEERGSLLVFLPGQGEIRAVAAKLAARVDESRVEIAPLFSALERDAQRRAIAPAAPGRRKVVLATSIAETSLTIEGVRLIVDSGLARVPVYEPDMGLTRLETRRASRAAVDQRRGRAGRTEPGVCYRLWEEAATGALAAFNAPEILSADLSGLVLDLAAWGVRDPAKGLMWLDPPPQAALVEARALLCALGALDPDGAVTEDGHKIRGLALPPRLARMVIAAASEAEGAALAADVAVALVERGLGGDGNDLVTRIERFRGDRSQRADAARGLAKSFVRQAGGAIGQTPRGDPGDCGRHLARAFPDRIAKARGKPGSFLMANGRAAAVEPHDRLAREPFLAIGEVAGRASAARILLAAPVSLETIEELAQESIEYVEETLFDTDRAALEARRQRRLGALLLSEQNRPVAASAANARVLAAGIARLGIARLPWTKPLVQWRDRVEFLRRSDVADLWPNMTDDALAATIGDWLVPFIEGRTSLAAISADDLEAALKHLLTWDLRRRLDEEAPTHFGTAAGSQIALDYTPEAGPTLAVRVQELYGVATHPTLARGRVPLTLELLSPAHRPIQITRDLPGFWRGSWAGVKAEMRGRYPKHLWPDDPATAQATARAKPRR